MTNVILHNRIASDQDEIALDLLPEVYGLLTRTLLANCEGEYLQDLQRVLEAARESEQCGFPITAFTLLSCQALGADPARGVPAAAAWRALHIAAKLLDDVEDGEIADAPGNNSASTARVGQIINLSTGFIAVAGLVLNNLPRSIAPDIQYHFNHAILQMAGGQHVDLRNHGQLTLDEYLKVMAAKTGAFFALAARAGAICAGADMALADSFARFGHNVGMLIQLMDDLADWRKPTCNGALDRWEFTLPVYYALTVAPSDESARLREQLTNSQLPVVTEAQNFVRSIGAEAYVLMEMEYYKHQAALVIESCNLDVLATEPLFQWVEALIS